MSIPSTVYMPTLLYHNPDVLPIFISRDNRDVYCTTNIMPLLLTSLIWTACAMRARGKTHLQAYDLPRLEP